MKFIFLTMSWYDSGFDSGFLGNSPERDRTWSGNLFVYRLDLLTYSSVLAQRAIEFEPPRTAILAIARIS